MTPQAAIHAAAKQLGLDEDTRRAVCMRVVGKPSTTQMSTVEQRMVLAELNRQGFKPASNSRRKKLEGRYVAKLQALWIAGWNLGVIRDRTDEAMIAFVKRQAKVDHVRFLHDPADAHKAIEGLRGWLARQARVDWSDGHHLADWMRCDGARIAVAQWRILVAAGAFAAEIVAFRKFAADHAKPVDRMADRDWIPVMNAFGEMVRKLGKA